MQPRFLRHGEPWLRRSKRDLIAARQMLDGTPPLCDGSVFHAQQAAEKALKGFLTAHGVPFPKTHALEKLIPLCIGIDTRFSAYIKQATALSPYATLYRYPGGPLEPPESEARQAIEDAQAITDFVQELLQPPPTPSATS